MVEARTHPPSEQRLSEARRAGHVPRAALAGACGALVGGVLGLSALGEPLWKACKALFRACLEAATAPAGEGLARLKSVSWAVASGLAILLACCWLGAALAQFLAQGLGFKPPFGRVRERFEALKPPRTSRLLAALAVLLSAGVIALDAWHATPHDAPDLLSRFGMRLAWLLVGCALVDAFLARAAFVRSLWMTRREHREALREAYGAPEVRALRARLRRRDAGLEGP